MKASLIGALARINRSWSVFEHKGKKMTMGQVRDVLKYGISKGYKTTAELSDKEIDTVLKDKDLANKSHKA